MKLDQESYFNPNYLKLYYGKLFPFADIFKWVSYGHDGKHPGCHQSYFGRREFSFTLENDIYMRFQSFNNKKKRHVKSYEISSNKHILSLKGRGSCQHYLLSFTGFLHDTCFYKGDVDHCTEIVISGYWVGPDADDGWGFVDAVIDQVT